MNRTQARPYNTNNYAEIDPMAYKNESIIITEADYDYLFPQKLLSDNTRQVYKKYIKK